VGHEMKIKTLRPNNFSETDSQMEALWWNMHHHYFLFLLCWSDIWSKGSDKVLTRTGQYLSTDPIIWENIQTNSALWVWKHIHSFFPCLRADSCLQCSRYKYLQIQSKIVQLFQTDSKSRVTAHRIAFMGK
jgi:hypothetical protein